MPKPIIARPAAASSHVAARREPRRAGPLANTSATRPYHSRLCTRIRVTAATWKLLGAPTGTATANTLVQNTPDFGLLRVVTRPRRNGAFATAADTAGSVPPGRSRPASIRQQAYSRYKVPAP